MQSRPKKKKKKNPNRECNTIIHELVHLKFTPNALYFQILKRHKISFFKEFENFIQGKLEDYNLGRASQKALKLFPKYLYQSES